MGFSSPNPPVGCVITDMEGNILSAGYTQKAGFDHAEISAYRKIQGRFRGHAVFVTLQPCTHTGRTPPCAETILKNKPNFVFYGLKDPNPLVQNCNYDLKYSKNNIHVNQLEKITKISEIFLNGFLSRIELGRPSVLVKTVVSPEGYFASKNQSYRISSPESDVLTQMLRAKFDAILVGPKTVKIDNPSLDFRAVKNSDIEYKILTDKNLFFSTLFRQSKEAETISIHYEMEKDYQPYRVFILGSEEEIPLEFIQNQASINKRLQSKKCVFFLLRDKLHGKIGFSESIVNRLRELTEQEILEISEEEIPETIFDNLNKLEINKLLVEGGNLLYKTFSKILSKYDSILKVTGNSSSISGGILPDLDFDTERLSFRAEAGKDLWEVFESCSRD